MTVAGAEPSATDPPLERLDSGVELLGRYEQSGYSGEQYLLRRPDGQVLQLSKLLYLVASALRATSSLQEAAEQVSGQFGKLVSAENIEYLIDNKLRQLDIFERRPGHPRQEATGTTESGRSVAPRQTGGMLSLRFRRALFPARAHLRITVALQRLFDRRVAGVVLVALLAADAWLLARGAGRVLGGATQTLEHPVLLLVLLGLIALANVFHEFGHAAATTYGGAKPGAMGAGVYLAMPVFFTDVTDSYRLDRNGRLRVDLGGVYFNAIAVLAALAVYAPTHFKLLLLFAVLVQMEALLQFLPFVRLDGYYVVADLIGVPNLFAFVRPVVARLLARPAPDGSGNLSLLTPRARRAITAWVLLTVPVLAGEFALTGVMAPTVAPAFWRSISHSATALHHALIHGQLASALASAVDIALLAVAPLGIGLVLLSMALRGGRWGARALTRRRGIRDVGGQAAGSGST